MKNVAMPRMTLTSGPSTTFGPTQRRGRFECTFELLLPLIPICPSDWNFYRAPKRRAEGWLGVVYCFRDRSPGHGLAASLRLCRYPSRTAT